MEVEQRKNMVSIITVRVALEMASRMEEAS